MNRDSIAFIVRVFFTLKTGIITCHEYINFFRFEFVLGAEDLVAKSSWSISCRGNPFCLSLVATVYCPTGFAEHMLSLSRTDPRPTKDSEDC